MSYKLGSLFDGSGGFPLAGTLCGIEPRWASEVEPYPIAVTRERFPNMKHLGDISKINGAEVDPVDIITFGSPCQDLSVAGKRAGLKHEANGDEETTRSGLFMEAVRIIKEMRKATNGTHPRFALWENVPGAFSSNNGEDFRIVIEELIKIVEPDAVMPDVPKAGWAYADSYRGDGWSLAYRVFDAQYWGVPQRRRRIHLVVDFRGECAGEVLFERQGVRGYFEKGRTPWEATPGNAEGSAGADDREGENTIPYTLKIRSGCEGGGKGALIQKNLSATLATNNDQYLFQPQACGFDAYNQALTGDKAKTLTAKRSDTDHTLNVILFEPRSQDGTHRLHKEVTPTLNTAQGGQRQPCIAYCLQGSMIGRDDKNGPQGDGVNEDVAFTCNTIDRRAVVYAVDQGGGKSGANVHENKSPTLTCTHGGEPAVAYSINHQGGNVEQIIKEKTGTITAATNSSGNNKLATVYRQGGFADYVENEVGTLKASGGDLGGKSENLVVQNPRYIVRRLTPTECARLQGFADWWGRIEPKDSLTDEEFHFWHEVRNTHAAINGKKVQEYTKAQILSWYNKLYTDSAEYKMWGNGIALPPALYCMQGISDALNAEHPLAEEEIEDAPLKACYIVKENETEETLTDLSEAPEEVKEEIIKNAELLNERDGEEETTEDETMETNTHNAQETTTENVIAFNAAEQLKRLAEERKALANLKPENARFSDDVRAIEYAISVLEAVGL